MSDRELFNYKLSRLGISEIVNDFNLEHSMKQMLLKRKLYKFKKEDFTDSELRDKALFQEELAKLRAKILSSEQMVSKFDPPESKIVNSTKAANCYLINKICEEGTSFARFKNRKIKFEGHKSPQSSKAPQSVGGELTNRSGGMLSSRLQNIDLSQDEVEEKPKLTVHEKMAILTEDGRKIKVKELEDVIEQLKEEERQMKAEKTRRFYQFKIDKEAFLAHR